MSNVVNLSLPVPQAPPRPWRVSPHFRLIDIFGNDVQLTGLCRYLFRTFDIWTIGELDAAGWSVVNGYTGKLSKKKRELFFQTIGRPPAEPSTTMGALVLPFRVPQLG